MVIICTICNIGADVVKYKVSKIIQDMITLGENLCIKIGLIPGDGIGPEVTREAMKVFGAAAAQAGVQYETVEYDVGGDRYLATGEVLPDSVLEELRGLDAIYLGAIGTPRC